MNDAKGEFFEEYDALASDASASRYQDFAPSVARWLEFIEGQPETAVLVTQLGEKLSHDNWTKSFGSPSQGMGGGTVRWPSGKQARIGAQLDLFRLFARGEWDVVQFSEDFQRSATTNLNEMTYEVVSHIYQPLLRDLRRYIDSNWADETGTAPGSDRVVRFDHNSTAYREAVDSLNRIRDAVVASNEYDDHDDKKQRLSELIATQDLLSAPQARVGALQSVGLRCLRYLADKFAGAVIGKLAVAAFEALLHLL